MSSLRRLSRYVGVFHVLDTPRPQDTAIARRSPCTLGSPLQELVYTLVPRSLKSFRKSQLACTPAMVVSAGNQAAAALQACCSRIWTDTGRNQGHHWPRDTQ